VIEYHGFCAWISKKASWGLGFDVGIAIDHVYMEFRILNRELYAQWEAGF
jgi:hypothetical protein